MTISIEDLEHVLFHTKALWKNVKKTRIFITGGTGFFGKWLLESFAYINKQLKLESELHVLSRNPTVFKKKFSHLSKSQGIFFYQGDVRDFDFPDKQFRYIIHAATDASNQLNSENPLLMIDTIIEGTRRVLEFARCCGAERLLFTSSGAVYGQQPAEIPNVHEDYLGAPAIETLSAYSEAKRLAELLCLIYGKQYHLKPTIARCYAFVGPYLNLDIHYAIGNFIRDGLEKRTVHVSGDGTPYRSYLYTADLSIWLWTILMNGESGKAYNVGADQELAISELAKKINLFFGGTLGVTISQEPVQGCIPSRYIPDISRAKKELGLEAWIDLDEAIERTIRFYK